MYKVFIVEDEIVIREGIRNSIPWESTQYVFAGEAPDGEIALSMIGEAKPDILVADIKMPFMDGLTLARIVKKNFPWIKIVILSGHDEFEFAREAISIGVEEYLLKPVSSSEMLAIFDKVAAKIDKEKESHRNIEELKKQAKTNEDILNVIGPAVERLGEISRSYRTAEPLLQQNSSLGVDQILDSETDFSDTSHFDESRFLDLFGEPLIVRLRYAAKKDIESIIAGYADILKDTVEENPLIKYYIIGEIIVAASKIVEESGGNIKEIIPFNLNKFEINDIIGSRDVFYQKIKTLFHAIIDFRDSRQGGKYTAVILKAKEYIDRHYMDEDISLHTVASQVNFSQNHFSAIFSQETGGNFIEYLTKVRIEKAKELLINSNLKSADIAYEVGFKDPHYFSFNFKKNTGISPREFRTSESAAKK